METKKEEEVNLAQMICDREISEKERKTMRGSWSVKQGNIAMVKLNGLYGMFQASLHLCLHNLEKDN